jgi:anti-sigma B factor antagonist
MEFINERIESVRVIHLYGSVDVPNAITLRDTLGRAANSPSDRVLVDLSRVNLVDSSALGVFVAAKRRAEKVGARFALAAPHERVARVLKMSGATNILDVHASVEEGTAALQAA